MDDESSAKLETSWIALVTIFIGVAGFILFAGYAYFWFAYYYLNRWPSQEQMVPSGYQMIREARQVEDLFGPAWHRISNYQNPNTAESRHALLDSRAYATAAPKLAKPDNIPFSC